MARTILVILTVAGGLVTLLAAGLVTRRAVAAKRRQRALVRFDEEYTRRITEHDRAYSDFEEGRTSVPPFDGMEMNDHSQQVSRWHTERFKELHGYAPGMKPPTADVPLIDDLMAELSVPGILAVVGILVSTVAGVWSLFV